MGGFRQSSRIPAKRSPGEEQLLVRGEPTDMEASKQAKSFIRLNVAHVPLPPLQIASAGQKLPLLGWMPVTGVNTPGVNSL